MDVKHSVLAANHAFYAAFRFGDIAAMDRMWATTSNTTELNRSGRCVSGRSAIMEYWRQRLDSDEPPEIQPREATVIRGRSTAIVYCLEDLGEHQRSASSVFLRENGRWRLLKHQSTTVD